jgi:hypothetical protein
MRGRITSSSVRTFRQSGHCGLALNSCMALKYEQNTRADIPFHQNASQIACAFLFLRPPSRLKAPRPVAKSGKVPGSGTAGNGSMLPVTTYRSGIECSRDGGPVSNGPEDNTDLTTASYEA